MIQNLNNNQILQEVKSAFDKHIQSGEKTIFSPKPELSTALGVMVRELESRRQTANLTQTERDIIRQVDKLMADIANFNEQIERNRIDQSVGELVYDLAEKAVKEDDAFVENEQVAISTDEADSIIKHIDKQFQEKVMEPVEQERVQKKPAMKEAGKKNAGEKVKLDEYLQNFRYDQPNVPFADEDSNFDLAKLAEKNQDA